MVRDYFIIQSYGEILQGRDESRPYRVLFVEMEWGHIFRIRDRWNISSSGKHREMVCARPL